MDATTPSSERKRSLPLDLSSETLTDARSPIDFKHDVNTSAISTLEQIAPPARKKPKLAPPRPLRIVRGPGINSPNTTIPNASNRESLTTKSDSSAQIAPLVLEKLSSNSTSKLSEKSDSPVAEILNQGPSHSSLYCIYCKRTIEGGESGKRRHQSGQKHVFRVLAGVNKFLAPIILPCIAWHFPPKMANLVDFKGVFTVIDEQVRLMEDLAQLPPECWVTELRLISKQIDLHLALFLYFVRPKFVKKRLKILDHDLLNVIYEVHNRLPIPSKIVNCPICNPPQEYSINKSSNSVQAREIASNSTSMASSSAEFPESDCLLNEERFLAFMRHLGGDGHRKAVKKFWRDHHVSHPNTPSFQRLTPIRVDKAKSLKKDAVRPHDDPRTAFLFTLPNYRFDSDFYALPASELQKMMESWLKLRKMVGENDQQRSTAPASEAEPSNPIPQFSPLPVFLYPPPMPIMVDESEIPLKQRILKFVLPGPPKKGERVGYQWANAVKAFIAANPGMSTSQIIKLSRLERLGDPTRQPPWFPSFGGVWNETTRADHKRAYFKSERKGRR